MKHGFHKSNADPLFGFNELSGQFPQLFIIYNCKKFAGDKKGFSLLMRVGEDFPWYTLFWGITLDSIEFHGKNFRANGRFRVTYWNRALIFPSLYLYLNSICCRRDLNIAHKFKYSPNKLLPNITQLTNIHMYIN